MMLIIAAAMIIIGIVPIARKLIRNSAPRKNSSSIGSFENNKNN